MKDNETKSGKEAKCNNHNISLVVAYAIEAAKIEMRQKYSSKNGGAR